MKTVSEYVADARKANRSMVAAWKTGMKGRFKSMYATRLYAMQMARFIKSGAA